MGTNAGSYVIGGIALKRNGHKLNPSVDESSTAIMGSIVELYFSDNACSMLSEERIGPVLGGERSSWTVGSRKQQLGGTPVAICLSNA
jgi:hypothetical protein